MSVTSTQSINPASSAQVAVGRYIDTGTAAAFVITVGFKARYVRVSNLGSGGSDTEWFEGMAAASAVKRVKAGDKTIPTTLGITVADKSFTVGLDTDLNVTSEQLSWMAIQ